MVIYPIGSTKSCHVCANILAKSGINTVDHPTPEITHLLLDVPSFSEDGRLRSGELIEQYLPMLPQDITVVGGNLKHTSLHHYKSIDLLTDENYLARNAAITAECAFRVAATKMEFISQGCNVLIIGWGRIGKCLSQLLMNIGSNVTVAARKETDQAILRALGYHAISIEEIPRLLDKLDVVYNTVPERILDNPIPGSCIAIELSSRDAIVGENIILARGLPGKYASVSSGKLMADTILKYYKEGSL